MRWNPTDVWNDFGYLNRQIKLVFRLPVDREVRLDSFLKLKGWLRLKAKERREPNLTYNFVERIASIYYPICCREGSR